MYDILSKNDGSVLNSEEISSLKLQISGVDKNSPLVKQIAEFQLVNGDNVFVPKLVEGDIQADFIFTVPSLKANESLKLITPDNFDGNVSFSINSVVFANGDVALSQTPLNLDVSVYSDGSAPDISVSDANALEDGPAFRLPINVTLKDTSESITQMKLTSSDVKDVFYLTRLQNVSLDGTSDLINDIGFDNQFIEIPNVINPSVIVRFAPNFKASQEDVTIENQIKNILSESDISSNKISSVEGLLTNLGLVEGKHWNFYATGQALHQSIHQ